MTEKKPTAKCLSYWSASDSWFAAFLLTCSFTENDTIPQAPFQHFAIVNQWDAFHI